MKLENLNQLKHNQAVIFRVGKRNEYQDLSNVKEEWYHGIIIEDHPYGGWYLLQNVIRGKDTIDKRDFKFSWALLGSSRLLIGQYYRNGNQEFIAEIYLLNYILPWL